MRASLVAQRVKNLPAMQETQVQSLGWEELLEKEMATNSSILVWRISMDREAWRLQSMESQSVGHDWATKHSTTRHKGCLIPLTEDTCNRQIHGVRKYTGRRQGPEDVGMRS